MPQIPRRDVLKYFGLAAAVSLTGISALDGESSIEPEKNESNPRYNAGSNKPKKFYKKAAELNRDTNTLAWGMNLDPHLFDLAEPGQDYIGGVAEGREHGILRASKHYFSDRTECWEFIGECAVKGKAFHYEYR